MFASNLLRCWLFFSSRRRHTRFDCDCSSDVCSSDLTRRPWPRSPPRSSLARLASTSLTFMLVCVPEPVCQTTSGNSPGCLPAITSSAAATIASVFFASCRPSAWLTTAEARLTWASALMISRGCCSPEMSKFCSERCVCAPQSLSAGTSMGTKVSRSVRVVMDSGSPSETTGAAWQRGRARQNNAKNNHSHLIPCTAGAQACARQCVASPAAERKKRYAITAGGGFASARCEVLTRPHPFWRSIVGLFLHRTGASGHTMGVQQLSSPQIHGDNHGQKQPAWHRCRQPFSPSQRQGQRQPGSQRCIRLGQRQHRVVWHRPRQ